MRADRRRLDLLHHPLFGGPSLKPRCQTRPGAPRPFPAVQLNLVADELRRLAKATAIVL
jgi:hypothetical protein